MSDNLKIAAAVFLPHLGGLVGRTITKQNINPWFESLKHPSFRPPNFIFGPTWAVLYSSIGYASFLVWKDGGGFTGNGKLPLIAYGTQLALNWAWSPIFFGEHKIKAGLIDLGAVTVTASVCGFLFYKINKLAGYLFVPYISWLGFASVLNYYYYKLNIKTDKDVQPAETNEKM